MGMTKPRQVGNVDLLNPEQRQLQNNTAGSANTALGQIDPNLQNNQLYQRSVGALNSILAPQSRGELEQSFKQAIGDPTMRDFDRNVLPTIQQSFADVGAGRSSALNQALAQASTDLSTNLASLRQDYLQRQQGQQIGAAGQAAGIASMPLQQLLPLIQSALQQSNQPLVQEGSPKFWQQVFNGGIQAGSAYAGAQR